MVSDRNVYVSLFIKMEGMKGGETKQNKHLKK